MSKQLLAKIDAAIERLRAAFKEEYANPVTLAISIQNLKEKRAIVESESYHVEDVTERCCAVIGPLICENTKAREPWYKRRV